MDYGKILSRAAKIVSKHKILWLFGVLASCASGGGGGQSSSFNFSFGSGDFTLEAWLHTDVLPGARALFLNQDQGGDVNNNWNLAVMSSGQLELVVRSTGGQTVQLASSNTMSASET